jgi:sulfoxide reductase heme-binding subunit YedZ
MRAMRRPFVKPLVFALCAVPLLRLAWGLADGTYSARPYAIAVQETGLWSLRLLAVGLLLSPLGALSGWAWPLAVRRMVGLFAALYAALHLAAWGLQYKLDWAFLWDEIVLRRFLTIGALAALLLLPLAGTSARAMHALLGERAWRRLHTLIYPVVGLSLLHFLLSRRGAPAELVAECAVLVAALAWRLGRSIATRRPQSAAE